MNFNMLTLIDRLQENHDCYFIDFLPEKMNGAQYLEIEEFFLNNYLKDFSEKIVRIIVKIIGYYPAKIFLTEFPDEYTDNFKYLYPVGRDISNKPIAELAEIITHIITNDISSVQVILGDTHNSLISVNGGFSVDIYNASEEQLKLFTALIEQENLFLRKEQ